MATAGTLPAKYRFTQEMYPKKPKGYDPTPWRTKQTQTGQTTGSGSVFKDAAPKSDGPSKVLKGDIFTPKERPGAIHRDAPSQDILFSSLMDDLVIVKDREATSSAATDIYRFVTTPSEREAAITALLPLLNSDHADVVSSAVDGLRKLRATEAIALLTELAESLDNGDLRVWWSATARERVQDDISRAVFKLTHVPSQPTDAAKFAEVVAVQPNPELSAVA